MCNVMTYKVFQDKLSGKASHRTYCKRELYLCKKKDKNKINYCKTCPMYMHQKRCGKLYTKLQVVALRRGRYGGIG